MSETNKKRPTAASNAAAIQELRQHIDTQSTNMLNEIKSMFQGMPPKPVPTEIINLETKSEAEPNTTVSPESNPTIEPEDVVFKNEPYDLAALMQKTKAGQNLTPSELEFVVEKNKETEAAKAVALKEAKLYEQKAASNANNTLIEDHANDFIVHDNGKSILDQYMKNPKTPIEKDTIFIQVNISNQLTPTDQKISYQTITGLVNDALSSIPRERINISMTSLAMIREIKTSITVSQKYRAIEMLIDQFLQSKRLYFRASSKAIAKKYNLSQDIKDPNAKKLAQANMANSKYFD